MALPWPNTFKYWVICVVVSKPPGTKYGPTIYFHSEILAYKKIVAKKNLLASRTKYVPGQIRLNIEWFVLLFLIHRSKIWAYYIFYHCVVFKKCLYICVYGLFSLKWPKSHLAGAPKLCRPINWKIDKISSFWLANGQTGNPTWQSRHPVSVSTFSNDVDRLECDVCLCLIYCYRNFWDLKNQQLYFSIVHSLHWWL